VVVVAVPADPSLRAFVQNTGKNTENGGKHALIDGFSHAEWAFYALLDQKNNREAQSQYQGITRRTSGKSIGELPKNLALGQTGPHEGVKQPKGLRKRSEHASLFLIHFRMRIFLGMALAASIVLPAHAQDAAARGRYLAILGDCAGCHTVGKGPAYAGGLSFNTPFGTIYSTNITPDHETGIGGWSADDFYKALHNGVAPGAKHLYPALPYAYFTLLLAAMGFWSGVLGSSPLNDGARALLVMTAAILTDLPGVVMLFAPRAICVMPHENAARFGITPLQDQQLAGLLMWVPANLAFFGIATFLFGRWIKAWPRPGAGYAPPSR